MVLRRRFLVCVCSAVHVRGLGMLLGILRRGRLWATCNRGKALQGQEQREQQRDQRPVAWIRSHDNAKHIIDAATLHAVTAIIVN